MPHESPTLEGMHEALPLVIILKVSLWKVLYYCAPPPAEFLPHCSVLAYEIWSYQKAFQFGNPRVLFLVLLFMPFSFFFYFN